MDGQVELTWVVGLYRDGLPASAGCRQTVTDTGTNHAGRGGASKSK